MSFWTPAQQGSQLSELDELEELEQRSELRSLEQPKELEELSQDQLELSDDDDSQIDEEGTGIELEELELDEEGTWGWTIPSQTGKCCSAQEPAAVIVPAFNRRQAPW